MSKSAFNRKDREKVRKIIKQAQKALTVQRFRIKIQHYEYNEVMGNGRNLFARCRIALRCFEASIIFTPSAVESFRENRQEFIDMAYHEVAHILTEPQNEYLLSRVSPQEKGFVEEMNEQLTETIARIAVKRRKKRT